MDYFIKNSKGGRNNPYMGDEYLLIHLPNF